MQEARLLLAGQQRLCCLAAAAGAGHPAQQGHELAAVADAQGPGVGPPIELLELAPQAAVVPDGARPALEGSSRAVVQESYLETGGLASLHAEIPSTTSMHFDRAANLVNISCHSCSTGTPWRFPARRRS